MCPGLGKLIRSQALSHHAINKPHDMSPFSHSPSPDQLPFLCTPFSFATYHVIYSACATMSAPTIAFVLVSPVDTDKKGQTEYTPSYTSHFVPLPHTCTHTLPRAHAHTSPCAHTLPHACTSPHTCTFPCAHTLHCTCTCTCTLPPPPPFALLPVHTSSSFIRLYTA